MNVLDRERSRGLRRTNVVRLPLNGMSVGVSMSSSVLMKDCLKGGLYYVVKYRPQQDGQDNER